MKTKIKHVAGISLFLLSFVLPRLDAQAQGCTATAPSCVINTTSYCCGLGIYNVTLNTINNSTADGVDGYQDYTCTQQTTLTAGQSYSISVTTGPTYEENVSIWIDYNNDGVFDPATELVFESLAVLQNHAGSINPPGTAVTNVALRMRVASDYFGEPALAPCNDVTYGQAEDYTVTIQPNPNPPVADFNADATTSCDGIVNFTDASLNAPTSWSWDFGDGGTSTLQNPTHTYVTNSTYTVTLIACNSNGCDTMIKSNYITVTIPTTPTITASGSTTFCAGGSVTLTSSAATSYLWSNGATTQSTTVSQSGDYVVTITDASGCTASSAPTTVTNNGPSVWASADPASVCAGGTTQLYASAGSALQENFDPTTTSQWSSITGTESTSCGSVSGNALYFSNAGTREAVTQSLDVSGGGTISFYLKIGSGASPCESADGGEDVLLQYSTDGGSTWNLINAYLTGTYNTFTLVNATIPAAAQTASTKFKWTQPSHSGSGFDNWAMDDVAITGSGTGSYSYSWSPTTGVSDPTIANPTAVVNANTTYTVTVTDNGSGCTNSASVSVTTFTPPTATITASGSTTFCQGDSVFLSANTGIAYLWSTGATTQNIYASQSGSYTVTVTYTGGCTSTSAPTTVTVNSPATPTITASGPTTFCAGDSVTLTSSPASSYLWPNGATTQSITISQSGNYTVTITDAGGCTASSAPITVINNGPTIWAFADPASACVGDTVQLNSGAGLQDNFDPMNTSQWASVTGIESASCGSVSGNALYFSNAGTREAVTENLNVSGGGTINFNLKIGSGASPCESADGGENVLLEYSTDGGSTWTLIDTYLTGGPYNTFTLVNATIPAGAQTTSTKFKWSQPSHSGSGFDNWAMDNVSIPTTGSYSFSWSPSTGLSSSTISNPTAVVNGSTTYSVTITDNNTGCSNTASVPVNVTTASITAGGATSFCTGGSVLLSASTGAGYTYQWQKDGVDIAGETTSGYTATTSGNYTVAVAANGCTDTSSAITVTVYTSAFAEITADGPVVFCAGDSVTLTANQAVSYQWSNGATTQSVTVNTSGSYIVTVTDPPGCPGTASDTLNVTANPLPATPTITKNGDIFTSSSATGNQWYFNGSPIAGATSQTYTSSTAGIYGVTVTDANGCTSPMGTLNTTGVEEKQLDESTFKAYPNPFSNETTISYTLNGKSAVTLEVFNILGEKIAVMANEEQAAGEHTYKLSTYATGIYVVHLRAGNHTYTQKVVSVR